MDEYDESLSKFILQLFNLAVNIIGIALIGIGAYKQAEHFLSADTSYTSYITPSFFFIVGVVILMTACVSKSFLQLFQRVFISIGQALICIGTYIKMQQLYYIVTGSPYLLKLGLMIGFAGIAIWGIEFSGYFGFEVRGASKKFMHVSTSTRKYSSTITRTFKVHLSAIVIIILLVEFGVGILAYVLYMVPQVSLQNDMENGLMNYGQEGHDAWAMDRVQRDFECCGVTNYTDWAGVGSFTEGQTPDSCCKEVGCGLDTDADTKYTQGCLMEFQKHILSIIGVMGGVVTGIFVIKLIGICVAWYWLSYLLAFKEIQVHRFGKSLFKITEN